MRKNVDTKEEKTEKEEEEEEKVVGRARRWRRDGRGDADNHHHQ